MQGSIIQGLQGLLYLEDRSQIISLVHTMMPKKSMSLASMCNIQRTCLSMATRSWDPQPVLQGVVAAESVVLCLQTPGS